MAIAGVALFATALSFPTAAAGAGATFSVARLDDPVPSNKDCSLGTCSLREAVVQANETPGTQVIVLGIGTFTLGLAGPDEDAGATGDLDVTDDLQVMGWRTGTTIDGGGLDRVLDVHGGHVTLTEVTLTNGRVAGAPGADSTSNGTQGSGYHVDDYPCANSNVGNAGGAGGPGGAGSDAAGGAIYNEGSLSISNSTIDSNSATAGQGGEGGAGGVGGDGVSEVQVGGDGGDGGAGGTGGSAAGGAIYSVASGSLSYSTVSGNDVALGLGGTGGAPGAPGAAAPLSGPGASGTQGGLGSSAGDALYGTLSLLDSIVSGGVSTASRRDRNKAPAESLCDGDVISGGHNLSDALSCLSARSDLLRARLGLKPLAYNGGSTPTRALRAWSPAIDRGNRRTCTEHDQRGIRRFDGDGDRRRECDIGAFEWRQRR